MIAISRTGRLLRRLVRLSCRRPLLTTTLSLILAVAGVVIDAIRCCKIALDRGLKGGLLAPSAYLMKSPPEQWSDEVARTRLEKFIGGAD